MNPLQNSNMPATLMRGIGDNSPPSPINSAKEAMAELSVFLKDTPVIANHADAKNGAAYVERTRLTLSEMETERKGLVDPINTRLNAINLTYRVIREPLEKVLKELKRRLTDFASAEEAKRIAAAQAAQAAAQAAEQAARDAEAAEREAIQNAAQGECTDAGQAIAEADSRFADFQKAQRAAAIAQRDVPVRLGSIMGGKAVSMHSRPVLVITDLHKAIKALGLTPKIKEAILSSSRDYQNEYNELPPGIEKTFVRSV